jgi:hypothetical protein
MGRQIHVDLERTIPAPPARVHAVLADYRWRERILPGGYLDYRVEEGGEGAGYRLRVGRRERPHELEVAEPTPGVTLVERAFAPRGLRRVHGELLDRLTRQLGAEPSG